MKEPVSFQQPMTSPTQQISSHELNDGQQGLLMYQDGFAPQQGFLKEGLTQQLKQGLSPQQGIQQPQQGLTQQQKQGLPPQQQGLPPQQQGLPPQQQDLPPKQQGLPPQQQGLLPQQQDLPPQQQGLSPQQQGLPPQQQGLPPQQQGLPPQQPSIQQQSIQEFLPPLLGNVEQHGTPPDQQIVLLQQPVLPQAQEVVSEQQAISLQQPQLHPQQRFPLPQPIALSTESPTSQTLAVTSSSISCDTVDTTIVTIGDHSSTSDIMMQSLLYSISKSPSIASENDPISIPSTIVSIPSSTSTMVSIPSSTIVSIPSSAMASIVSNEGATPHASSSSLETSLYGNIQSGGVITVQAPQSNSLDQLDPLG